MNMSGGICSGFSLAVRLGRSKFEVNLCVSKIEERGCLFFVLSSIRVSLLWLN